MDAQALRFSIMGMCAAVLVGCSSTPAPVQPPPQAPPATAQAPKSSQAAQPAKPTSPPPASEQPPQGGTSNDLIKKGQILVTKAEYNQTFEDVRRLILDLNRIIAARDYDAWTKDLTPAYVQKYSDLKTLDAISNQPMLKRQGFTLSSLKDYFLHVVVPSRADAHLDDVEFVSKTQVKAITIIDGQRYILYDLRFQDGSWKIGVS